MSEYKKPIKVEISAYPYISNKLEDQSVVLSQNKSHSKQSTNITTHDKQESKLLNNDLRLQIQEMSKQVHDYSIRSMENIDIMTRIKTENDVFSTDLANSKNYRKETNSENLEKLAEHYVKKGYKVPNFTSNNYNLFKLNPLMQKGKGITHYYENKENTKLKNETKEVKNANKNKVLKNINKLKNKENKNPRSNSHNVILSHNRDNSKINPDIVDDSQYDNDKSLQFLQKLDLIINKSRMKLLKKINKLEEPDTYNMDTSDVNIPTSNTKKFNPLRNYEANKTQSIFNFKNFDQNNNMSLKINYHKENKLLLKDIRKLNKTYKTMFPENYQEGLSSSQSKCSKKSSHKNLVTKICKRPQLKSKFYAIQNQNQNGNQHLVINSTLNTNTLNTNVTNTHKKLDLNIDEGSIKNIESLTNSPHCQNVPPNINYKNNLIKLNLNSNTDSNHVSKRNSLCQSRKNKNKGSTSSLTSRKEKASYTANTSLRKLNSGAIDVTEKEEEIMRKKHIEGLYKLNDKYSFNEYMKIVYQYYIDHGLKITELNKKCIHRDFLNNFEKVKYIINDYPSSKLWNSYYNRLGLLSRCQENLGKIDDLDKELMTLDHFYLKKFN